MRNKLLATALLILTTTLKAATEAPSEYFRKEHANILVHLAHVEKWAGELQQMSPEKKKETRDKIVSFFKDHIGPHAEWEEKKLYPAVDKRTGSQPYPFTSSMRYEHKIVERWTREIDEANKKNVPSEIFTRKTDQLLGLVKAHFEEEEEVLLPILDKTMTREQFKTEVGEEH